MKWPNGFRYIYTSRLPVDADKGRRYDVLPLDQGLDRAVEAGLNPGVSDLIRKMDAADMPSYPRLLKE